jgi:hypothetical protein
MLSSETLVFTRARNTFSPLASTLAMHRSRFSCRSNAAFRALSTGFMRASHRRCAVDDSSLSSPTFCFLADRRLARDIQRTRSATHHIRWCWLLVRGASDEEEVSFDGKVTQHGVDAISTRAAAARRGRPPRRGAARATRTPAWSSPRGERDQRLAEAAVRVGEAEEVVEQALRERGPRQPPQRVPGLRVAEELREGGEHAADLRRGGGDGGRRRRDSGGLGLAGHQAQRGHVVVQLEDKRVEAAGKADRPDAVRGQLVARSRQVGPARAWLRRRE